MIDRTCRDASYLRNNPSGLGGRDTVASSVPNPQGAGLARNQLGRNLTYGLLGALGRAIVVGDYKTRRSEERRVGKGCVSTFRCRGSPTTYTTTPKINTN